MPRGLRCKSDRHVIAFMRDLREVCLYTVCTQSVLSAATAAKWQQGTARTV